MIVFVFYLGPPFLRALLRLMFYFLFGLLKEGPLVGQQQDI